VSYQLLSITIPVARKEYRCVWCPEKILKGEKHIHESSKYDGRFQDHRWHPECKEASEVFFRTYGEDEFQMHACKRGTMDEV